MARPQVGIIGLGALGRRVAARLIDTDFNPYIYDMVDVAVRFFTNEYGGMIIGSPKMMAELCDVVVAVVPTEVELRDVAFGWEGVGKTTKPGRILLSLGSCDAAATVALSKELGERGVALVDAPAFGTPDQARRGKLTVFVGGEDAAVERCMPVLDAVAETVYRTGPVGSGQAVNALTDALRAVSILGASEAIRVSQAFGIDPARVLQIAEAQGGLSPAIAAIMRGGALSRGFETGLPLGVVRKDVQTAADLARSTGVGAPVIAAAADAWTKAEAQLGFLADQSAMVRWLEGLVADAKPEQAAAKTS